MKVSSIPNEKQSKISNQEHRSIKVVILPENYWTFTFSLKDHGAILENKSEDELELVDSLNKNFNIYDFKPNNGNRKEEFPFFLSPRKDWNIKQGDFIIKEKKEVKQKLFTKTDFENLKKGAWFILLSLIISFYLFSFFASIV